jgi:hypothetical protein
MHEQFNLLKPTGYVIHQQFNLLKTTGYVMHQQFNKVRNNKAVKEWSNENKLTLNNGDLVQI